MTSTSVAVIVGGGTMGADVAIVFARGGWRVVVVEPAAERRQALGSYWTVELDKTGHGAAAGAMSAESKMDDLAWDDVAIVVAAGVGDSCFVSAAERTFHPFREP